MNIWNKIKKYKWFLTGLVILTWVIFVNLFPEGYIVAGEDTNQLINIKQAFWQNFYEWQGRASLFFGVFYLLDKIGVSESSQLSWYLGLFIFGAYLSFQAFVRIVFRESDDFISSILALFYALNLYTLTYFSYSWSFSHYQILYVFIPLIVGLYIEFLKTRKNVYGALFCLSLFFASPGFANPAFSVSLFIFLSILTVALLVFKEVRFNGNLILKLLGLSVISVVVGAYWIFPVAAQFEGGVSSLSGGNILDLEWWIQHTSNSVANILRLRQFNDSYYFPSNFPYKGIIFLSGFFSLLSAIPAVLIAFSLKQKKDERYKGFFWAFVAVLGVFVMLTSKVRFPFEKINNFLFQLPGFNTLRGYEKLAIFIPFIMAVVMLIAFLQSRGKRYYKAVIIVFLFVIITPLPFFVGKIQQNVSFILANEKQKDFKKSDYSFLVKIPQEYYDIQGIINNDKEDINIASLPFNAIGSIGWVNYPKWKLQGADVTEELYTKKNINPNSFYFNQWLFAKDFNDLPIDPKWMADLLGIFNVKYVIYHKDVATKFVNHSIAKMDYLEKIGAMKKIATNDYFDLYVLNNEYRLPSVYFHSKNTSLSKNPFEVMNESKDILSGAGKEKYEIINPKKIVVDVERESGSDYLVLNKSYDSNWQAYYVGDDGRQERLTSFVFLDYSNGWKLDKGITKGKVIIEYLPFKLFQIGLVFSVAGFLVILVYLIWYFYERRKR